MLLPIVKRPCASHYCDLHKSRWSFTFGKGLPANTINKLTERDALIKKCHNRTVLFWRKSGRKQCQLLPPCQWTHQASRSGNQPMGLWTSYFTAVQSIYKVKCLNHTTGDNYLAPGNVSLVVIPDIVNNNAFDIYQPRVSTAKRNVKYSNMSITHSFSSMQKSSILIRSRNHCW